MSSAPCLAFHEGELLNALDSPFPHLQILGHYTKHLLHRALRVNERGVRNLVTSKELNKSQTLLLPSVNSIAYLKGSIKTIYNTLLFLTFLNGCQYMSTLSLQDVWHLVFVSCCCHPCQVFIAALTNHYKPSDKATEIYSLTVLSFRSLTQSWAKLDWLSGREQPNVYLGPTLCQILWYMMLLGE